MKYPPSIISVGGWAAIDSTKKVYTVYFNLNPSSPIAGKTCHVRMVNVSVEGLVTTPTTGEPDTSMTFAVSLGIPQQWGYELTDTTSTSGFMTGDGTLNRTVGLYCKTFPQPTYPRCIMQVPMGPQQVAISLRSVVGTTFDDALVPKLFVSVIFEIQEVS